MGGVQTPPPPPPAGGGKSRGPAGRGLSRALLTHMPIPLYRFLATPLSTSVANSHGRSQEGQRTFTFLFRGAPTASWYESVRKPVPFFGGIQATPVQLFVSSERYFYSNFFAALARTLSVCSFSRGLSRHAVLNLNLNVPVTVRSWGIGIGT